MRLQRSACSQRAFFRRSKHKDETVHCAVSPGTTHLFRRRQQGGDHVYFLSAYQNSSRRPNVRDVKYRISGDSAVAYRWKRSRIHRGMNAACPDHLGPCHPFQLAILSLLVETMETITISYCAYYDKSDVRLHPVPGVGQEEGHVRWQMWGREHSNTCKENVQRAELRALLQVKSWSFIHVYRLGWGCRSATERLPRMYECRISIQYGRNQKKGGGRRLRF